MSEPENTTAATPEPSDEGFTPRGGSRTDADRDADRKYYRANRDRILEKERKRRERKRERRPPEWKEELREGRRNALAKYRPLAWAKSRGGTPSHRKVSLWAIAEDALLGLPIGASAEKRGVTRVAVFKVRKRMGFPKGWPGFYRHGEVLTRRHIQQFCEDIGVTQKQAADIVGFGYGPFAYRVRRIPDRPLSGRDPKDPNSRHVGRLLAEKYENVIERHCQKEALRGRFRGSQSPRDFLTSETRDIPGKHSLLMRGFSTLRKALKSRQLLGNPLSILNWVCEKAKKEVACEPSEMAMRTMLFFGLPLLELLTEKPELIASGFRPRVLASKLLARDYRVSPSQIDDIVAGTITPMDPRGMRQLVLQEVPQAKPSVLLEKKIGTGGRKKLDLEKKRGAKIATAVAAETRELQRGLGILRKSRRENAPVEAIHRKILTDSGFNSKQIDALLGSKTPIGAAQRYVALLLADRKHPNGLRLQTVRSACSRYRKLSSPPRAKD